MRPDGGPGLGKLRSWRARRNLIHEEQILSLFNIIFSCYSSKVEPTGLFPKIKLILPSNCLRLVDLSLTPSVEIRFLRSKVAEKFNWEIIYKKRESSADSIYILLHEYISSLH